jgi:hypothetical protein
MSDTRFTGATQRGQLHVYLVILVIEPAVKRSKMFFPSAADMVPTYLCNPHDHRALFIYNVYRLFYRLKPVRILFLRNIYLAKNTREQHQSYSGSELTTLRHLAVKSLPKQTNKIQHGSCCFRASLVRVGFSIPASAYIVSPDGQGILLPTWT